MSQRALVPSPSRDRLERGEARITMTFDDYEAWLEESGDRGEWVDGEVVVFELPSFEHQDLILWLGGLLRAYVLRLGLGVVAIAGYPMRVDEVKSTRLPDILFVASPNLGLRTSRCLDGPADLAVEVVSPSSGPRDRREKLHEYASAGVREYWVVDLRPLRRELLVHRLDDAGVFVQEPADPDGTIPSSVFPDLRLPVAWFWQDPLPDQIDAVQALLS